MESGIRLTDAEWEQILDAVPDLIAVVDGAYRIVRVNTAMCRYLGVGDADELIGRQCYEVLHGTRAPPAFCPHAALLEDHEERVGEVVIEETGETLLVKSSPLRNADGRVRGSVHIACNAGVYGHTEVRDDRSRRRRVHRIRARLDSLTPREREVLEFIIGGLLNKQVAAEMGIAEKTVKIHRGRVMRKMQVASFAELVRACDAAGVPPRTTSL